MYRCKLCFTRAINYRRISRNPTAFTNCFNDKRLRKATIMNSFGEQKRTTLLSASLTQYDNTDRFGKYVRFWS